MYEFETGSLKLTYIQPPPGFPSVHPIARASSHGQSLRREKATYYEVAYQLLSIRANEDARRADVEQIMDQRQIQFLQEQLTKAEARAGSDVIPAPPRLVEKARKDNEELRRDYSGVCRRLEAAESRIILQEGIIDTLREDRKLLRDRLRDKRELWVKLTGPGGMFHTPEIAEALPIQHHQTLRQTLEPRTDPETQLPPNMEQHAQNLSFAADELLRECPHESIISTIENQALTREQLQSVAREACSFALASPTAADASIFNMPGYSNRNGARHLPQEWAGKVVAESYVDGALMYEVAWDSILELQPPHGEWTGQVTAERHMDGILMYEVAWDPSLQPGENLSAAMKETWEREKKHGTKPSALACLA